MIASFGRVAENDKSLWVVEIVTLQLLEGIEDSRIRVRPVVQDAPHVEQEGVVVVHEVAQSSDELGWRTSSGAQRVGSGSFFVMIG